MYKFRIKDNYIFRDKINSDKIIIDSEPIIDKHTLLQALAQWTQYGTKTVLRNMEYCKVNPTDDCPNCPRYKDDCEGLEQYEMPELKEIGKDFKELSDSVDCMGR